MEPLRHTATAVFRTLLEGQPTTPAKVACAWQVAAGPAMARASRTIWTGDGFVRVSTASAAWRREIERAKPVLLDRVRGLLGPSTVRAIVVID